MQKLLNLVEKDMDGDERCPGSTVESEGLAS
jgi:hypothetical protein